MKNILTPLEILDTIVPGENYPKSAEVNETIDGKPLKLRFILNSYIVGMYCAIYINNEQIPTQTGNHDNKKFVKQLKKNLAKAIERGAKVTIGSLCPVKAP